MNAYNKCYSGHISDRDMQVYIAQDNMETAIDVDGKCHLTPSKLLPDDLNSDMFSVDGWKNLGLSDTPTTQPYYKPTIEEMSEVISSNIDSIKNFIQSQNVEPQNND